MFKRIILYLNIFLSKKFNYFWKNNKIPRNNIYYQHKLFWFYAAIVLATSFLSVFHLFHKGIYPTHDAEYHIIRFYEFYRSFTGGSFYPRWAPDLNYGLGVPLFNYVYPLPNYAALILHFFGFSFIDSFKASVIIATIIGGVFFFLWSKEFWGNLAGLTASTLYLFSPYRFLDIYIRGSIGEIWGLSLFPACLYFTTVYFRKRKLLFLVLTVFSLALVIFSHNILALMFFSFFIFYLVFLSILKKDIRFLIKSFLIIILALGLSCIFWLPALLEKKFVSGLEIYNVFDNFPELFQLIFPSWGSGFSNGITGDQMSFQIGITNLLAVFLSFFSIFLFLKRKEKFKFSLILFFLTNFFLIFFMMLSYSHFFWKLPLINYFQFPWRFLNLEIIIAPFLSAGLINSLTGNKRIFMAILFIFFSLVLTLNYSRPDHYFARNDLYYFSKSNFIDGTNSPGNLFKTIWWDNSLRNRQSNKLNFSQDKAMIIYSDFKPESYFIRILAKYDLIVKVNTVYFPGWQVFVDNNKVKIIPSSEGLILFKLDKGEHILKIKLLSTLIQKIAGFISGFSFFFSLVILIIALRNYSKKTL